MDSVTKLYEIIKIKLQVAPQKVHYVPFGGHLHTFWGVEIWAKM